MKLTKWNNGFTLVETLVVMGVFLLFLGFISINLINREPGASLNLNTASIVADIKKQQLKAMTGDSYNNSASEFGVYFEQNRYTVFAGNSYQPGASSNSVIEMPDNLTFSDITIPGATIVFNRLDGDMLNFIEGSNTFTVTNSVSNESITVTFNRLGTATGINEN